jgi:hypothetical protein
MAISVNWGTKVITIPKADLTLVDAGPPEIYELDVNDLHLWLKDAEDSEEGMPHLDTHSHNTEVTLGGITYARFVEMINGYTITFEDGQYRVKLTGGNNNVLDVANVNQVSIAQQNSAGLIVYSGADPATVAGAVWDRVLTGATHNIPTSAGRRLRQLGDVTSANVTAVVAPTTLAFTTDLTQTTDDFFTDQLVRFTSGNLQGLVRVVSAYNGTSKMIIVD